jgi:hypothetical protein
MNTNNRPSDSDLPSLAKLIKSTFLAITLAAIILITGVLPAEYGIDPTGVGNFLGLSRMGEIKVSLAQEAAAEKMLAKEKASTEINSSEPVAESVVKTVTVQVEAPVNNDEMTFSLKPDEWREIKLKMNKGEQVSYIWWTNDGRANFDAHADSKKHKIDYHNYGKGSTDRKEGIMEAAFDGKHGWFWRNRTSKTMTITLQVKGDYSDIEGEV